MTKSFLNIIVMLLYMREQVIALNPCHFSDCEGYPCDTKHNMGCCECQTIDDCNDPQGAICEFKEGCNVGVCNCKYGYEWIVDLCIRSCPPGYKLIPIVDGSCAPCPAGTVPEPTLQVFCDFCAEGKFTATEGSTTCETCPGGTFNIGTGNKNCCYPGQANEDKDCVDCGSGKRVDPDDKTRCIDCEPGYYSDQTRNDQCTPCAANKYQSLGGQNKCEDCPEGSFSPGEGNTKCCSLGQILESGVCVDCGQGTYSNPDTLTDCLDCQEGYFSDGTTNTNCKSCTETYGENSFNIGTRNNKCCGLGEVMIDHECVACGPGTEGYPSSLTACIPCEPGFHSNQIKNPSCTQCPIDHYQEDTTRTSCTPCQPGSYQPDPSQTSCLDCHDLCATCSGTAETCFSCITGPGIFLKDNKCLCDLEGGYYEHNVGGELRCDPCHEFCQTCSGDPKDCQSCRNIPGVEKKSNECLCIGEGYNLYHDPDLDKDTCIPCHPLCSSCFGALSTECYTCESSKSAVYVDPNTCTCSEGYYYDSSLEICLPCNAYCSSCFGPSAFECDACQNSLKVKDQPWCVLSCELLSGYYTGLNTCESNSEE